MDGQRFDQMTRALATGMSRRRAIGLLTGGATAGFAALVGRRDAAAKGKRCTSDADCPNNQSCATNGHCTRKCDPLLVPLCPACQSPVCTSTGYQCQADANGGACPNGTCCGGACVDTTTSAGNCGACGYACLPGQTCAEGSCLCPGGLLPCPPTGECVDTENDPSNCGACGHVCPSGQTCGFGVCTCPGDQLPCGPNGECANTASDPNNCGACGHVCAPGETCSGGQCSCGSDACPSGQTCVDGSCRCSGFQEGCAPYEVCSLGLCVAVCPDTAGGTGVHNGTFTACPGPDGTFARCGCNGCSDFCDTSNGVACCSDGCRGVVTTCAG